MRARGVRARCGPQPPGSAEAIHALAEDASDGSSAVEDSAAIVFGP